MRRSHTGGPDPRSPAEIQLFAHAVKYDSLYGFGFNEVVPVTVPGRDGEMRDWSYMVDLVNYTVRLIVEIDGLNHHGVPHPPNEMRDGALADESYRVEHIPSYEVTDRVNDAVREIEGLAVERLAEWDRIVWPDDPTRYRTYPRTSDCGLCARRTPGHSITPNRHFWVCLSCLAPHLTDPYRPPHFTCAACKRPMREPTDVLSWTADVTSHPETFRCPACAGSGHAS